jgi:hypothetical protein
MGEIRHVAFGTGAERQGQAKKYKRPHQAKNTRNHRHATRRKISHHLSRHNLQNTAPVADRQSAPRGSRTPSVMRDDFVYLTVAQPGC